ncbi:hypothetical protein V2P72_01920 [Mesomycoplasma hyopneumoniae]|uniref:hypothetical protein n=1 Tax=Mesomycoplasma hyopneumoniae TaxID=2099 RepID=UPI003DA2D5F0
MEKFLFLVYWISVLPIPAALSCQNNPPQYTNLLTPLIRILILLDRLLRFVISSKSSSSGLKSSGYK